MFLCSLTPTLTPTPNPNNELLANLTRMLHINNEPFCDQNKKVFHEYYNLLYQQSYLFYVKLMSRCTVPSSI